jgi:pimeloyl-ACP methyl ester carboxylesterase
MPVFERGDVSLHYEEYGSGYPVLLFAPGGMRSAIDWWHRSPFDPTTEFSNDFRVIAMDQRNAGGSRAPITAADSWDVYTADHLALLDHLGIERCHVMGGCIGSSYCLSIVKVAPDRISAAVLQNPIGLSANNSQDFVNMFDEWAEELKPQRAELRDEALNSFRDRMFGGDFVFSVSRDFVHGSTTPFLVLAGDDSFHPTPIAREIVELAPNAELILKWKTPDVVREAVERVRAFLNSHTPVAAAG